jgi:S1-C subfamily serine protease
MVRGKSDWISRLLLFKLSELMGTPKYYLLYTPEKIARQSIFIIDNLVKSDQGTGFLLHDFGLVTNEHVVKSINNSNLDLLEIYKHDNIHYYYKGFSQIDSYPSRDVAILSIDSQFKDTYAIRHIAKLKPTINQYVNISGFPSYAPGQLPKIIRTKIIGLHTLFGKPMWEVEEPLEHGISGSPVFNDEWELLGIATFGSKVGNKVSEISTRCNGFIPISFALNQPDNRA